MEGPEMSRFSGIDQFTAFPMSSISAATKGRRSQPLPHSIRVSVRIPRTPSDTPAELASTVPYIETTQEVAGRADTATTTGESDDPSQIPRLLERLNRAIARLPPNNTSRSLDIAELPPEYDEM